METIIAILVYFGVMSFGDTGMSQTQYQYQIQNSQQMINYISSDVERLQLVRAQIDRLED